MTDRLNCENDPCDKQRKYYCSDHNEVICSGCFAALHILCMCDEIPELLDVKECLKITTKFLESIDNNSERLKANFYIKNFNEEFEMYSEMVTKIDEEFSECTNSNQTFKYCLIKKNILQLQKKLIESRLFMEYIKLKELKIIAGDDLSEKVTTDMDKRTKAQQLMEYKNKISKEMIEHNKMKLESKIQEEQKNSEIHSKNSKKLTKELREHTEELKTERRRVTEINEEIEEQKQREEQKESNIKQKFKEIYENNMGERVGKISNFHLKIDMSDPNYLNLIKDLTSSSIRLPDLVGLSIKSIPEGNTDINNFFIDCVPSSLKLLCINCNNWNLDTSLYIDSLCNAVSAVSKQVYLSGFLLSTAMLQQIVRAARNTRQVVFDACSIDCSAELSFGSKVEYKTKYLSFQRCGDTQNQDLNTSWIYDPSEFSKIIEAIAKSGLKQSLAKIYIGGNQTLNSEEVQELLNGKGMDQISVVGETIERIMK